MELKQLMQLEDLKKELSEITNKNSELYNSKIEPLIRQKKFEFISEFERFFNEQGFETINHNNQVTASYNTLSFTANLLEDNQIILIEQNGKEFARVSVVINSIIRNSTYTLPQDSFEAEKIRIRKDIEKANLRTKDYENPEFNFINLEKRKNYTSVVSLLSDIF